MTDRIDNLKELIRYSIGLTVEIPTIFLEKNTFSNDKFDTTKKALKELQEDTGLIIEIITSTEGISLVSIDLKTENNEDEENRDTNNS